MDDGAPVWNQPETLSMEDRTDDTVKRRLSEKDSYTSRVEQGENRRYSTMQRENTGPAPTRTKKTKSA